jgi:hypothetical protein
MARFTALIAAYVASAASTVSGQPIPIRATPSQPVRSAS